MKLNLGCGLDIKEGFKNIDVIPEHGVDTILNIETDQFPYPTNSIQYIYCNRVLETLNNYVHTLKECHRVLKPNSSVCLIVPHFSSVFSARVFQNRHQFCTDIFDRFLTKNQNQEYRNFINYYYGYEGGFIKFSNIKAKLIFRGKKHMPWNHLCERIFNHSKSVQQLYERTFLKSFFPADEIEIIMTK